ncbi:MULTISPECIES: HAD family hydrolase [unclassified Rhizobium]|uniref:HAD family hydrolase n=1 Tax=unclassified Rhizobium TaxID=2613769 RepID=UPI0007EA873C|nr:MULTISPECIES: HAD family hydrolase [unclassified Rhizobium]ANM10033.1 HAD superfamily hydrolase protein [Rhizobium sp. N324]ANM16515.1 HAD superfamily hydrolase protein [Rhizobium sp. N541]ANM22900.1 HAD superfamily hydrolase protein [Rhizobium sp. N941]OYD03604.1 HAD superfamily hydrolase protein [Rhizobium sp. N4311]
MPALHDILDRSYDAFLFDMDGTLLNSIAVVERVWSEWARRHGFEPEVFLKTIHGIRASDVIRGLGLPGVDPAHEADLLLAEEMEDVSGIVEIPDAVRFLSAIPDGKWAIVTSAPIELAVRRMAAAGIPMPNVIVSGGEVKSGKPSPEGYLLGASRLGVDPEKCLVFEDAVAGILAGEAAGADVAIITETHATPFETPHFSIANYQAWQPRHTAEGRLTIAAI